MDYLKAFPALEGLVGLASKDRIDINPTLLRVLTDLYVTQPTHSSEEEQQYTELAMRLLDVVDVDARKSLAQRLARYSQAPLPIVQRLARDVITVAEPILRYSPCLVSGELLKIAREMGPEHVAAVLARDRPHWPTEPRQKATPSADPVAAGTTAAELTELFFAANSTERRLILLTLDYATLPAGKPIKPEVAGEAVRRLEAAALSHNRESFVRELAQALSLSSQLARRLADDPSGEPIVVAAKALSMPSDAVQRILLCLNPTIGQSIKRVYDLADLFEELRPEAAQCMVASWQNADQRTRRPNHQPQYWNDEVRQRRETGSNARRFGKTGLPDPRANTKRNWR